MYSQGMNKELYVSGKGITCTKSWHILSLTDLSSVVVGFGFRVASEDMQVNAIYKRLGNYFEVIVFHFQEVSLGVGENIPVLIQFDPSYKDDFVTRTAESQLEVSFKEHPQKVKSFLPNDWVFTPVTPLFLWRNALQVTNSELRKASLLHLRGLRLAIDLSVLSWGWQ